MSHRFDILSVCAWGPPKEIIHKGNTYTTRYATPDEGFWLNWGARKRHMKQLGIRVGKVGDEWTVRWMVDGGGNKAARRSSDTNIPCPPGKEFYPYQIAGVEYMRDHTDTILGDDQGLGKTIQVVGLINLVTDIKKVLISAPGYLKINWRNEIRNWGTRNLSTSVIFSDKSDESDFSSNIVIINYEILEKFRDIIGAIAWDFLVCDEAHYLMNPDAKRTCFMLGGRVDGVLYRPIEATRRVYATGTLIKSRPIEMWPIVRTIDPLGLGKSRPRFVQRYCKSKAVWVKVRKKNGARFPIKVNDGDKGACNLDELQRKLRAKFMIRRLKSEVLADLPPKQRQVIELPVTSGEAGELVKKEWRAYEDYEEYRRNGAGPKMTYLLSEMSAAAHAVAVAKVPLVNKFMEDLDGQVLCFAHHRDIIAQIADNFEKTRSVGVLIGGQSVKKREEIIEDFADKKLDLIVAGIMAAGTGINLQRCQQICFAEIDWSPGTMAQAEDRCHRIGQTGTVFIYHLVLEGSLDAKKVGMLIDKQKVIDGTLNQKGVA